MNDPGLDPSAVDPILPEPSPAPAVRQRHILVVEDDALTRRQLQMLLEKDFEVVVDTVGDGDEALHTLEKHPYPYSIVVTDLQMPKVSGMELIEAMQKRRLSVAVIVTTGHGSVGEAVQAMRLGATDFLTKPLDIDHLRQMIGRILRERTLEEEAAALRNQRLETYTFHGIVSQNPRMHAVFEMISQFGKTTSTVLIEGPTGTGKEMVARAIHQMSPQRQGPFVAINCAAVPEQLLESELFGHEKGAFTGAYGQRKGRFELADGGSLFLDEVGDVPATMQAKLLRVLQERCFERVGGTKTVEVDVRVIAATNRRLPKLVRKGQFREDLYYRLNVVKIELPSLAERQEDIPLLAAHFCHKFARRGTAPKEISPEAMELLLRYSWPGNVRELENVIERACVTSREEVIRPENLSPEILQPISAQFLGPVDLLRPLSDQLPEMIASFEERYLRQALKKTRGHIGRAARMAGLCRRSLTTKIARYRIDREKLQRWPQRPGSPAEASSRGFCPAKNMSGLGPLSDSDGGAP